MATRSQSTSSRCNFGSFDSIVGMDWFSSHRAEIVCFEKIIRIPIADGQTLRVIGEKPSPSSLNLITCSQAHTYLRKKYVAFVAHVVEKKEHKIEDNLVVREYHEVFPDEVFGLPLIREVEFRIDLMPGATLIAKAPYRLAPSEMQELSTQLQEHSEKGFHTSIGMAPFEALYVRKCRSSICWNEIGETQITGPKLVQENNDRIAQIQQNLLAARSRQRPLEFNVGDRVLVKVSSWKGVVRFGKKGILSPRYVGPLKILDRVGSLAYTLELPQELANIHPIVHLLNLKKCLAEENLHILLDEVHIDESMHFVEKPMEIMDRLAKETKRSRIPLVKAI
ncbi:uncharacterized protein LOC143610715 [Bidens hawaiensis]|uniref:uncharacterized protein LOC143610715 n=1 Tax=Bidens hawaiensis TaxID=980011 RepID=UPI00404AB75F